VRHAAAVIDEARALYQVAPKEFVAARNALVKSLKASGRRDDAAEVAALRRPRLAEYGLNLVAAAHPEVVEQFAAAVAEATEAQRGAIERGEGGALRAATDALRAATARLVAATTEALDAAGESGDAQRIALTEILRGTLGTQAIDLLCAGVLGSSTPDDDDEVGALEGEPRQRLSSARTAEPSGRGPRRRTGSAASTEATAEPAVSARESRRDPSRGLSASDRRDAARAAKERAAERRQLERELRTAHARVANAERDADRARQAFEEAQAALDEAVRIAAEAREAAAAIDARRAELD
jgi:hypothetical protein